MNTVLWVVQIVGALLFGASGVMKVFLFDKVSGDVPSFGALPRGAWTMLGIVELVCTVGLLVPALVAGLAVLTPVAAAVLACETVVFVHVHVKYRETGAIVFSVLLGLTMAFLAWGRAALAPLS